ncbi:RmlC-like cupins superfamily protein [Hibiscus syriacus]|uniref:RmlC-like cupins superfamily protein n=1 Tax=Hibiscus syriacus TaxID=106335 RepID=A0A6A2XSC6_HIBSY|nr:RmlC-like cupins superfamily protein [Hibiscus syriacus]
MDLPVIQPPPLKICGSPNGPSVTAPRIRLKDGRYLAYKEYGVPKDVAKYKIIYVHGFKSGRHNAYVANTLSPEIIEELGVYIVSFDRPGYGESDPNPKRTVKSMEMDIEELADHLQPEVDTRPVGYSRCSLCPWLFYWWNTQKLFPVSSALASSSDALSSQASQQVTQGVFESLHRDLIVLHGAWEFDPLDLANPFSNNEGSVHLWHGDRDKTVPITINRPWIHYHEISGASHFFPLGDVMSDAIIKALLIGGK